MKPERRKRGGKRRSTDTIDKDIGARARQAREAAGLSQAAVAALLRVTGAQIHQFEYGSNRIMAAYLFMMSQAYGVPINYFYEGLSPPPALPAAQEARLVRAREFAEAVCALEDAGEQADIARIVARRARKALK